MTSTLTRFACGVAPVYPGAPPAAIPATKVPWPRPSPGESCGSVLSLTFASTRFPKSARFSIPESTTAIVGAFGPGVGALTPVQFWDTPLSYGHSWLELYALTCTGTSAVTIRFGLFASLPSLSSLTVAATASIEPSRRLIFSRSAIPSSLSALSNACIAPVAEPVVLWRITCTSLAACFFAACMSPGEIHVRFGAI